MGYARSIKILVVFNKKDITDEIEHSISSLTYTDNSKDAIDDLELELENLDYRWLKEWYPDENAQLIVGIFEDLGGDNGKFLDLGTFYIDEPTFDNNRLNLKCIALLLEQNIRDEKNSKAWEKITLKELITQMANKHEMGAELHCENEFYERLDQDKETDLSFLNRVVKETGLNLKVADDKIIVFDDEEMEKNESIEKWTITDYRIRSFSLKKKNKEIYDKVEVSYYDADKKKMIKEIITKEELEKRNNIEVETEEKKEEKKTVGKKSTKKKKPPKKVTKKSVKQQSTNKKK